MSSADIVLPLLISPDRPKSTPTPTASYSANGVPTEAVDYDRLKQVGGAGGGGQLYKDLLYTQMETRLMSVWESGGLFPQHTQNFLLGRKSIICCLKSFIVWGFFLT